MAKPIAKLVALAKPKRRWTHFSLGTLFAVVTLLCIWLAVVANQAHRQREAVAAIRSRGGTVIYDYQVTNFCCYAHDARAPGPRCLRGLLESDYFSFAVMVLFNRTASDAGLEELALHLKNLPRLGSIFISSADDAVTDRGVMHIAGLTDLTVLSLHHTLVTNTSLARLKGLVKLRLLDLHGTRINDEGLVFLAGLKELRELSLEKTTVTDAGVAELQRALPNCEIHR